MLWFYNISTGLWWWRWGEAAKVVSGGWVAEYSGNAPLPSWWWGGDDIWEVAKSLDCEEIDKGGKTLKYLRYICANDEKDAIKEYIKLAVGPPF